MRPPALRIPRRLLVVAAVLLLAGAVAASTLMRGGEEEWEVVVVSPTLAHETFQFLYSFGPRLTGTESCEAAVEASVSYLSAAGLNVTVERHPHVLFEVRSSYLALIPYGPAMNFPLPGREPLEFVHAVDYVFQGYSWSYTWNDFRDDLEVTYVENYEGGPIRGASGKALVLQMHEDLPGNLELMKAAKRAGAKALIIHNTRYDPDLNYPPIFKSSPEPPSADPDSYPKIPFLMVSRDVGNIIRTQMNTTKLRLKADIPWSVKEVPVVVATYTARSGQSYVIFGGHMDTVYNGPGGVDNTAGAATVMALAVRWAELAPSLNARFLLFTGEEEGLFGSTDYVSAHRGELEEVLAMFNFDMNNVVLSVCNRVTVSYEDNSSVGDLKRALKLILRETPSWGRYEVSFHYTDLSRVGSDCAPFSREGVSSYSVWGCGSREYHTPYDDSTRVFPDSLAFTSSLMATFAVNYYS
ncbi:MAG: M28 family peptidase [Thermoplasmata archaeon]|nr:M28 family peptidase [Thermoplasmata archaeon]